MGYDKNKPNQKGNKRTEKDTPQGHETTWSWGTGWAQVVERNDGLGKVDLYQGSAGERQDHTVFTPSNDNRSSTINYQRYGNDAPTVDDRSSNK